MKILLCACALFFCLTTAFSQPKRLKAEKYPSLLWEITGKGLAKRSYLFGTMHVSNKMVFNLSDSFYLALRTAQIVALETNPGTWQEDFSRYDMDGEGFRNRIYSGKDYTVSPQDYLSVNTLKLVPFEKRMETALYRNPSLLNSFLYRSNSENGSDFEEDTYLDLHIFQAGRKLGKRVCGVEDFHASMQLVKEAYADAAKEKKTNKGYDYDDDFSYSRLEEAYRTGNLDLLDTINKTNSQSAAFDEKFLYKRNDIQATSIDSILKTGAGLFAGVGAAHLPGERGVIEQLRRLGYKLRPIKMSERDSRHKESIEKIRVPVQFKRQVAEDGFYSVMVPGKLYGEAGTKQYADMVNGSYYIVTRITTNAAILGLSEAQVQRKLDSVLYENIPGKILLKKAIQKNGYRGYDITNRTRRGDLQRYQIYITPFEVLLFKMSGNGDYVKLGMEAEQFFNSIQLKEIKLEWKRWSPAYGGFEVELPHTPLVLQNENRLYAAFDASNRTAFEVIRTDIHNYDFLEEDSFNLELMEESFASSEYIDTCLSRKWTTVGNYKTLEAKYRYKDSTIALAKFLLKGPHYYTLLATGKTENRWMQGFMQSFSTKPFAYGGAKTYTDTLLSFRVSSPVALEKESKLSMYPEEVYQGEYGTNADDSLINNGSYKSRVVAHDSTGERVYVTYYRQSPYYFRNEKGEAEDSTAFKKEWIIRSRKTDSLASGIIVTDYGLGHTASSRMLKGKTYLKDGMGYKLETLSDTAANPSAFIKAFFQTFDPLDDFKDMDVKTKKTDLFFSQFFSTDTLQHQRAVKNIGNVQMDSTDFVQLQKAIGSLNWKEKQYLPVKKEFIGKLASMASPGVSDFLQKLYYGAGDTLELQYKILETLLDQQTAYAYQTFAGIMQTDPPVLDATVNNRDHSTTYKANGWKKGTAYATLNTNGSFINNLNDSLLLSASIFKNLLPLITINDYEQPLMELMGELVDSSLLRPQDYAAYLPKFMLEAKQALKKQQIQEKAKAIEKAQSDEEEKKSYQRSGAESNNTGNSRLSLYASLLMPFWDKHPQVPQLINQLLNSNDKRLQLNTIFLLLRNNKAVKDSLLHTIASSDEFRTDLFDGLQRLKKEGLFPKEFANQESLARGRVASTQAYTKPDTIIYLRKLPLQYKGQEGYVYFFKYKEKKDGNNWKLATAGMFSKDSTQLHILNSGSLEDEEDFDFTALAGTRLTDESSEKTQLKKLLKRMLYSRRKSASQFYNEEGRYSGYGFNHTDY